MVLKKAYAQDGKIIVTWRAAGSDWNAALNFVKGLPGRTFRPRTRDWEVPDNPDNRAALESAGWEFPQMASAPVPAPVVPSGPPAYLSVKLSPEALNGVSPGLSLRPYQVEAVQFLIHRNGRGLVGDEMGVGKTCSGLGYFLAERRKRPVLVVCKATAKGVWADHIRDWLGERFHVIRGQSLYELPDADWYIINYDILSWRDRDQLREEKAKKAAAKEAGEPFKTRAEMVGWYKALMNIPLQGVIGDEIQMISNPDALMSKAFAKLAKHSPVFIPLSGTPIRNRPADFFTVLNLLAPEEFPNRWKYLHKYCGPKHNGFGWEFKGSSNEDELHERIKPLMIRRLKEDVMKDLPPKQRIIIPMELSPIEVEAYNELDEEFMEWIRGHAASPLEAEKFLSRLKQKIYLMKRESVLQWIRDYIESGQKLVVFAYHRKVLEDLHAQFDREGVLLYGGTSEIDRQTCIKRFQNDDDIRLFFGQTNAAGDSITLTAAAATAFVEYPDTATQVNQCEDRVHRYGQKADSVFAYHLVAPGTTDADIMGMLQEKFEAGNQILDGRSRGNLFGEDFENFNAGLLAKYRRRAFEK